VTAKIAKNGDSSDNKIVAELDDELDVDQENSCKDDHHSYFPRGLFIEEFLFLGYGDHGKDCLENDVYADAFSGFNEAERNTGDPEGDPSIETGNAETTVEVWNAGNSNVFGDVSDWELPGDDEEEEGNGTNVNVTITFDLEALLGMLGLLS
jgi:hypothetical protein